MRILPRALSTAKCLLALWLLTKIYCIFLNQDGSNLPRLSQICYAIETSGYKWLKQVGGRECLNLKTLLMNFFERGTIGSALRADKQIRDLKLFLLQVCLCNSVRPCFSDENLVTLECSSSSEIFKILEDLRSLWLSFRANTEPLMKDAKDLLSKAQGDFVTNLASRQGNNGTEICHSWCSNCGLGSRIDQLNTCLMYAMLSNRQRIELSGILTVFSENVLFKSVVSGSRTIQGTRSKVTGLGSTEHYLPIPWKMGDRQELVEQMPGTDWNNIPYQVASCYLPNSLGFTSRNLGVQYQERSSSLVLWHVEQLYPPVD